MNKNTFRSIVTIFVLLIMHTGQQIHTTIKVTNLERQIINNVWLIKDNKSSIEDVNTRISNIDPVESLIFQGEELEPWHHTFQYLEDWVIMTWAVLDTSLMNMEEVIRWN